MTVLLLSLLACVVAVLLSARYGMKRTLFGFVAPAAAALLLVKGHEIAGGVVAGWLALFWVAFAVTSLRGRATAS